MKTFVLLSLLVLSVPGVAQDALVDWHDKKSTSLKDWLSHRGEENGPPDFIDFYFPEHDIPHDASAAELKRAKETKELFNQYFPPEDPSSAVGTFFESGHPYIETVRGPYQWNSLEASGMSDPKSFQKIVSALRQRGIRAMRIGPNLHEVELGNPKSWDGFLSHIETIWKEGGVPTISVAFFPSLKRWEVKNGKGVVDYKKSYLLHPEWPSDMGQLTEDLMERLWQKAKALEEKTGKEVRVVINGINEPETLAGFNRHFWHGAFANWGHLETMRYYVPSVIQIGKANVAIRTAVEKTSQGRRILFMHNEAMTPAYYPSHHGGGRFAVSKFMLGDDAFMKLNFEEWKKLPLHELEKIVSSKKANEVEWSVREFVFGSWNKTSEAKESARAEILKQFSELREAHKKLFTAHKKSMRDDMMLHLDYYYQTEFIPNTKIPQLLEDLSAKNGAGLKSVLGLKSDKAFLAQLKRAATENSSDLPAEGPKGMTYTFDYDDVTDVPFMEFLSQDDFVLLERLIGLRREYTFSDDEPFASRQAKLGLRPLKSQLYRSDEALKKVASDFQKIFGVSAEEFKVLLSEAAKISGTTIKTTDSIEKILNADGRAVLHQLLGIKREFLLGFEPQHYARQIRAGIRYGFYDFFMEYVNALRIYTVGVGESGTPFYVFAPLLHDQVMMEYARALKNGLNGTQYSFGPAVHTRGWAKAPLGLHYEDDHEINPSGIFSLEALEGKSESREWIRQFLDPLFEALKHP